ncbi:NAD(P)-binding protein [Aspergillus karnatakaensis]|uniref:NAD(P)-dependent oxidoreductase n=1 Tax=Aspergillus karnatakaensis TaxID=1810916 RepID=UPI003CCDBA65
MAAQIAWIGLGNMGRGLAKNLAVNESLTSPLVIYNRTLSRAESFASQNANTVVASTISEVLSKADVIFTCVGDDAAIQKMIGSCIAAGNIKDKLFIDCSTVHPDTTSLIAAKIEDAGGNFVASPVFGAPAMAEAGQVICVLAGPKDAVDKAKEYTAAFSKGCIDFSGQDPAKASLLKIMGNTFVLRMVEAIAEGLVVAEKSGLGTDSLHQFFETVFPGPYVAYSARMRSGDYYQREEPLFAVGLARKDARHALGIAEQAGAKMRGVELADRYLAEVQEMGARGDLASMYGVIRREAGLSYEN